MGVVDGIPYTILLVQLAFSGLSSFWASQFDSLVIKRLHIIKGLGINVRYR